MQINDWPTYGRARAPIAYPLNHKGGGMRNNKVGPKGV